MKTWAWPFGALLVGVLIAVGGTMFWTRSTVIREGRIAVTLEPEDRPEFARVYSTTVGDGFTVKVKMHTSMFGDRYDSSELTQKNGKWILFDANAVADKIIDRDLYPLVQAAVDEILALDKAFLATNPSEFTDDTGAKWKRQ